MQILFDCLTRAIQEPGWIALFAAVVWGICSVLLSPCHLGAIPLIVGFINGQNRLTTGRAMLLSFLFSFGLLVSMALLGTVTVLVGRLAGDIGPMGNWILAIVFFGVGLQLLDVIPALWTQPGNLTLPRKGGITALIMGLCFGIALGPCTFAFMAPILGIVFQLSHTQLLYSIGLLAAFVFGHCAVIGLAGTWTCHLQQYLDWNQRSNGALKLRRICGILTLIAGLYMVYRAA